MQGMVPLFNTPPHALGDTQNASSYMLTKSTFNTRNNRDCNKHAAHNDGIRVQNGVVADCGRPQLHPQPLQLIANLSSTLHAAFAGDDAGACSNKVAAERQADLAAALDSDQFALESLTQKFRSRLP